MAYCTLWPCGIIFSVFLAIVYTVHFCSQVLERWPLCRVNKVWRFESENFPRLRDGKVPAVLNIAVTACDRPLTLLWMKQPWSETVFLPRARVSTRCSISKSRAFMLQLGHELSQQGLPSRHVTYSKWKFRVFSWVVNEKLPKHWHQNKKVSKIIM